MPPQTQNRAGWNGNVFVYDKPEELRFAESEERASRSKHT